MFQQKTANLKLFDRFKKQYTKYKGGEEDFYGAAFMIKCLNADDEKGQKVTDTEMDAFVYDYAHAYKNRCLGSFENGEDFKPWYQDWTQNYKHRVEDREGRVLTTNILENGLR
jgi:hypothetical protein